MCGAQMSNKVLAAALAKADFYAARPAKDVPIVSTNRSLGIAKQSEEAWQMDRIKPFIEVCLTTDNEDLVPVAFKKLANLDGVPADVARRRAKDIFLPLVSYTVTQMRSRSPRRPQPDLSALCRPAVSLFLDGVTADPKGLMTADITSMVDAIVSGGQSELLLSKYVSPRVA